MSDPQARDSLTRTRPGDELKRHVWGASTKGRQEILYENKDQAKRTAFTPTHDKMKLVVKGEVTSLIEIQRDYFV